MPNAKLSRASQPATSVFWAHPHQNPHPNWLSFSITQMTPRSINPIPNMLSSSTGCSLHLTIPALAQTHPIFPDNCSLLQPGVPDSSPALLCTRHHSGAMITYKMPGLTVPAWLPNLLWLTCKIFSRHSAHTAQCRAHSHSMNILC